MTRTNERQRRTVRGATSVWLAAAMVVGLGVVWSAPVALAAPSKAELAQARRLFAQASVLERAKRWKPALEKLRRVVRIKETAGVRYHIAFCLENLGHNAEAFSDYWRAKMLAADGSAPDVASMVDDRIEALREKLVLMVVKDDSDKKHEIVMRVDEAPALLHVEPGQPIAIEPGVHRVVIQVDGRVRVDRFIEEKPGAKLVFEVSKKKKKEASPRPDPSSSAATPHVGGEGDGQPQTDGATDGSMDVSSQGTGMGTYIGWGLVGLAGAAAVGGFVSYSKAGSVAEDSKQRCAEVVECDPRRREVVRSWDSVALGLWAGAVVAAGTGVTILLLSGSQEHGREAKATSSLVIGPGKIDWRTAF